MKKRPAKKRPAKTKPKIKIVKLAPKEALHIVVPPTVRPVVIPHPERGIVAIVPVPKAKRSWWQTMWD